MDDFFDPYVCGGTSSWFVKTEQLCFLDNLYHDLFVDSLCDAIEHRSLGQVTVISEFKDEVLLEKELEGAIMSEEENTAHRMNRTPRKGVGSFVHPGTILVLKNATELQAAKSSAFLEERGLRFFIFLTATDKMDPTPFIEIARLGRPEKENCALFKREAAKQGISGDDIIVPPLQHVQVKLVMESRFKGIVKDRHVEIHSSLLSPVLFGYDMDISRFWINLECAFKPFSSILYAYRHIHRRQNVHKIIEFALMVPDVVARVKGSGELLCRSPLFRHKKFKKDCDRIARALTDIPNREDPLVMDMAGLTHGYRDVLPCAADMVRMVAWGYHRTDSSDTSDDEDEDYCEEAKKETGTVTYEKSTRSVTLRRQRLACPVYTNTLDDSVRRSVSKIYRKRYREKRRRDRITDRYRRDKRIKERRNGSIHFDSKRNRFRLGYWDKTKEKWTATTMGGDLDHKKVAEKALSLGISMEVIGKSIKYFVKM